MAQAEQPRLRVVDAQTGEVHDSCPTCDEWSRKYHGVLAQLGKMRADLQGDEGHAMFPVLKRLHDYWRERCNHPRSTFGSEEFKQALPRLKDHDEAMCRRAIDGAAYDCFTTTRKNGSVKRHDDWELIFRKGKFEEFCNRAPYHLPSAEKLKTVAEAIMFLHPDWETDRAVAEAKARLVG